MLGPRLIGQIVALEPLEREDVQSFRRWFADPNITRFLFTRSVPSEGQCEGFYNQDVYSDNSVHWSIRVAGQPVGATDIYDIDWVNRHASTRMIIDPSAQGRGYARETVALRTRHAFEELDLERLETESFAENVRMHRALMRSGYQQIARRRRAVYRNGCWQDTLLFELLRDEWRGSTHG